MNKTYLIITILSFCLKLCAQYNNTILSDQDKELYEFVKTVSDKKFTNIIKIVDNLLVRAKTEEDTVKLFYLWIADNIAYDTKSFSSGRLQSYTPEETIKRKRAVCSGYSTVFKEMCDYVGIKCYLVNGYAKAYGYKKGKKFKQSDHAWNAVYVNDEWKLIDPTWGAGYVGIVNGSLKFTKKLDMSKFYTDPETFVIKHLPADPNWQLLDHIIPMSAYVKYSDSEDMFKYKSKEYYNYKDSIVALEKLNEEEKLIKQAENAYAFYPADPNYLGIHYYNYAITLSEDNTGKEQLQKALVYFDKAKKIYSQNKLPNSKSVLQSIKQGVEYVEFYLAK